MEVGAALALAAGGVLVAAWVRATLRDVRARATAASDWDGADEVRTELWTSAARCLECGAGGGVVEPDGDALRFTCLRCGASHARTERG